jgi:hypothetical protein
MEIGAQRERPRVAARGAAELEVSALGFGCMGQGRSTSRSWWGGAGSPPRPGGVIGRAGLYPNAVRLPVAMERSIGLCHAAPFPPGAEGVSRGRPLRAPWAPRLPSPGA